MKFLIACILLAVFAAGCGEKDARTLSTIFHGVDAVSELDRGRKQDEMLDRMIKLEEQRQKSQQVTTVPAEYPDYSDIEVVDVRQVPAHSPERLGKLNYLLTYKLRGDGVRSVEIAADDLTADVIRDAVQRDLEQRSGFVGLKLKLEPR